MSDDADRAVEKEAVLEDAHIKMARQKTQIQVVTWAGECDECGEDHPRLVKWVCPRCRDRLGLP